MQCRLREPFYETADSQTLVCYVNMCVFISAIVCDAQNFSLIENGHLTNYKEIYSYMETMNLQCDNGYEPIDGIISLTCLTPSSFSTWTFGCKYSTTASYFLRKD